MEPKPSSSTVTGFKISLFSEAGFTYQITLAKIDEYFDKSSSGFKQRCQSFRNNCRYHEKALFRYHEYIVYYELNKIPGTFMESARRTCFSNYDFLELFKETISDMERSLSDFEKKSMNLMTPEGLCLQWFNGMASTYGSRWKTVDSLRDTMKKENRDHLVDHFLKRARSSIETRIIPCLEKMLQSSSKSYAQLVEKASKDKSALCSVSIGKLT